jgi:hypothetical protein
MLLLLACVQDPSPVLDKGPPKSVTVEDSFKSCRGCAAAEKVSGHHLPGTPWSDVAVCQLTVVVQPAVSELHALFAQLFIIVRRLWFCSLQVVAVLAPDLLARLQEEHQAR